MTVQVQPTQANNQQQAQKPANIQAPKAMNFTPKPIGVIDPLVPSSYRRAELLASDSFKKISKEKKLVPNAQTGIIKAVGAFLMVVGGLAVVGYLFQHKKLGPIITVNEFEKYVETLTDKTLNNSIFDLPKRKINLFFPADRYPIKDKAGNVISASKENDVKRSLELIQQYISRFAQDGETHEVKIYLKNPEKSIQTTVDSAIKDKSREYRYSKDRNLVYELNDVLHTQVERIELDHKTSEGFLEKLALKRVNRENPVIVKIISPTYVDDRSLNKLQDWLL